MKKTNLAVVLYHPEIPQNTGNIIRLCANAGAELHLIKPLGWGDLNDTKLRRSGLDYHEYAKITVHETWQQAKLYFGARQILAIETSGTKYYHQVSYESNSVLLFGSETKGLPLWLLEELGANRVIKLPMREHQRSLNLSNSVAISVYEAWRQLDFL